MTIAQKDVVRDSYLEIRESAESVVLLFYGRLFDLDPSVRPLFRSDIEVQGRKLMDMLTAMVDNLDALDSLAPALRALGQRHAGYGVRTEHYDLVRLSLVWAIGQVLGPAFDPETRAAWHVVLREVSAIMIAGAAELPREV